MSDISKLIEALRVSQAQMAGGTPAANNQALEQFVPLDQPMVYSNQPMPEGSSITAMSSGRVPQAGYVPVPQPAAAEAIAERRQNMSQSPQRQTPGQPPRPAEGGSPAHQPQEGREAQAPKAEDKPAEKPAEKK